MDKKNRAFSLEHKEHYSVRKAQHEQEMSDYWDNSLGTTLDKLNNFTKFSVFF